MISNSEIDEVLEMAAYHFDYSSAFRGVLRKQYFLEALRIALRNKQSGMIEGVCHNCLGTGYEPTPT
jgi:hypothetical protein